MCSACTYRHIHDCYSVAMGTLSSPSLCALHTGAGEGQKKGGAGFPGPGSVLPAYNTWDRFVFLVQVSGSSLHAAALPSISPPIGRYLLCYLAHHQPGRAFWYIVALAATLDRKSTRLNSSHIPLSRMPSSA